MRALVRYDEFVADRLDKIDHHVEVFSTNVDGRVKSEMDIHGSCAT